jgi:hypothetical protein
VGYLAGQVTVAANTAAVTFSTAFGTTPVVTLTPEANDNCYLSTGPSTSGFTVTCGAATTKVDWTAVLAK